MMSCPPQAFLREGGTLEDLRTRYGVEAKRHLTFPNLVQLKYNQIASPMAEPIVQECRGLILDEEMDWQVIAWPFKKFFNYGEPLAPAIDWHTAVVQEKLDGSLCILYHYDNKWRVATSGTPDASGMVHGTSFTFEDLFWNTFERERFMHPHPTFMGSTFMFELTSPFNRVVVPHATPHLRLIGVRSVYSGIETPIRLRPSYNPVREFKLNSLEGILESFKEMDPLAQEGYVVVDACYNRVKVKHPGYVALHHLRTAPVTQRRVLEIVRAGQLEEFVVHFPEWAEVFYKVQAAFDGLAAHLEQHWNSIKGVEDRKTFAAHAKLCPYFPTMFHLRDGTYASARESLASIQVDTLADLLGIEEVGMTLPPVVQGMEP